MREVKMVSVGDQRGTPRIWVQGEAPRKAGFEPDTLFRVVRKGRGILLEVRPDGDRKVSRKRYASGKEVPVLDIACRDILAPLAGCDVVRVVFGSGKVYMSPIASEIRRQRRLSRLRERLANGRPLDIGEVAFGGGVLGHAVHAGMKEAGVKARLSFANELRDDLLEHARGANDVITDDTRLLAMPLQELAFDQDVMQRVGEVDIVAGGIPCSGASIAGRSKLSLGIPEEHPEVGHLIVATIAVIAAVNPAAVVIENVPQYSRTASAVQLRSCLRDLGYDIHETEVLGTDWGELEARRRWCFVAVSKGIPFDLSSLRPGPFPVRTLGDVLEPMEEVADRWSPMPGLKAKQERDRLAGKGFEMQIFDAGATRISTLTKGIAKNRSTDPKIAHPTDPDLLRIPTAREHARCKGVPERLIEGLSQTTAHALLGQSIAYRPFCAIARHLADALKRWATSGEAVGAVPATFKAAA